MPIHPPPKRKQTTISHVDFRRIPTKKKKKFAAKMTHTVFWAERGCKLGRPQWNHVCVVVIVIVKGDQTLDPRTPEPHLT